MARRLELKTVTTDGLGPAGDQSGQFSYAEMLLAILRNPLPNSGGLSLDEVINTLPAIELIENARNKGEEQVTISDQQWALLVEKLAAFRFSLAHRSIADFGTMIRLAPEIGTAPAELMKRSA